MLTPHAGEYERLAGRPVGDDRVAAARELAAQLQAIVLLKGPGTVIAAPDGRAVVNRTGNAALATAGTGDVLTGVIGGLARARRRAVRGSRDRRVRARAGRAKRRARRPTSWRPTSCAPCPVRCRRCAPDATRGRRDADVPARVGRGRSRCVRANVRALREFSAPAQLLAVVKADGYGHGAVPVARAALDAGAVALGVALVEEGIELREAGIDAPILVLSEPVPEAAAGVVHARPHARRLHRSPGSTRSRRRSPIAARATGSRCT